MAPFVWAGGGEMQKWLIDVIMSQEQVWSMEQICLEDIVHTAS